MSFQSVIRLLFPKTIPSLNQREADVSCQSFGGKCSDFIYVFPPKKKLTASLPLKMNLVGGFKCFLCSFLFGEDSHFDQYFSKGLDPPTRNGWKKNFLLRGYPIFRGHDMLLISGSCPRSRGPVYLYR